MFSYTDFGALRSTFTYGENPNMTQVSAPAATPSAKTARSDTVSPAKISAKQRILTAARQAFSELGYEAASLKVIGERCGVKRTLIMYHFTSKEGLWQAVVLVVKNEHQAAFNRYYAEVDLRSDAMRARLLPSYYFRHACPAPPRL